MMQTDLIHHDMRHVTIGRRRVGPGNPAYVIAEAGVNHDGSLEKALALVDAALAGGADAVKFQMFKAEELTTASAATAEYQKQSGESSQREMLAKLELSDEDYHTLRTYCRDCGIEFLATPFGNRDIERLLGLQVNALKTASTDLNNIPLLRRALETGLPMIVSTGAANKEEIAIAVERFRQFSATARLILLHCVSAYPTPLDVANLRAINTLRSEFGVISGFSDHTTDARIGAWAVALGANVLEKHFTLDRTAVGPDHAMSLDPPALCEYIAAIRDFETALGTGTLEMNPVEADVRKIARKSVVAAIDLSAGDILTPESLTTKRPAGGIEPVHLDTIVGRRLAVDVSKDTAITWNMLK